jgi:hypothetical protein
MPAVLNDTPGDRFMEEIKQKKDKWEDVAREAVKTAGSGWEEHNEFLTKDGLIYVPADEALRHRIFKAHHDNYLAGHPGQYRTAELITRNYYWPTVLKETKGYVAACPTCQRTKIFPAKPRGPLHPNAVPEKPWQYISIDLIVKLPESNGYDSIAVIVDRLSKAIRVLPCTEHISAEGIARLYRDHVWKDYGLPEIVISDRGQIFVGHFMRDLLKLLGVKSNASTAYHPQTDGQTERVNQEIEQYLRVFTNFMQDDWSDWLAMAEFSYNDKIHTTTGFTPFYTMLGFHPRKGTEPRMEVPTEAADNFAKRMQLVREEAAASMRVAQDTMKRFYDRKRGEDPGYKPGDEVYLSGKNLTTHRPMKKLDDKRHGPFKVVRKVGALSYELNLPATWKVHPIFNTVFLKPWIPPVAEHQKAVPPPPPDVVDGVDLYEVGEVLNIKQRRKDLRYYIRWEGYPKEEYTWEPRHHLVGAEDAIAEYYKKNPWAPREIPNGKGGWKLERPPSRSKKKQH